MITDIIMPGMDGIELLREIKKESDTDVIVVTGHTENYSFDEVIEQGADDFIHKPINSQELVLRLKRVLRMRSALAEKNRTEKALKDREIQLRRVVLKASQNQEALSKKFAMELHDRIGQNLTALNLNLNALKDIIHTSEKEKTDKLICDSMNLVTDTAADVRNIMSQLRPVGLDDYGLAGAIGSYVKRFTERTGIHVGTNTNEYCRQLSLWKETTLFRITQEVFTNIAKHSKATHVNLTLTEKKDYVRYIISDNGVGFDTSAPRVAGENSGWGIVGMKERAVNNNLGLHIDSENWQGDHRYC